MAETANRTLVCSVLFIDIVGYSRRGVTEQVRLKRLFNGLLASALEQVPPRERVVVDTGDGAAITGEPRTTVPKATPNSVFVRDIPLPPVAVRSFVSRPC